MSCGAEYPLMTVNNIHKPGLLGHRRDIVIGLFLVLTIFVVYWQTHNHDFVNYDDGLYVTANHRVQAGLNLENTLWAFSSFSASNWHPLTWLSHMLDIELYGMNAGAHHQTNIIFHIMNTLLLFIVFRRMTGKSIQSAVVAALFALHPLHVESVAWVSERKDVLSTFFWMLTLYSYAWYVEHPAVKRYACVVLFFMLGLMTKPMLVTLPFVLLLLDLWPLKRFQPMHLWGTSGSPSQRRVIIKLIVEKIPLFVLVAISSIVTFLAQHIGGSVAPLEKLSFADRLTNASVSYVHYIVKMIWPARLAAFYPRPDTIPVWQVAGSCLLLAAVFLLAVWSLKKRPWIAVGWLWYVGTLIPVIGLVQVGLQAMADRYTYVPLIGLFIICAWGAAEIFTKWPSKRIAAPIAAVIIFAPLMILSWLQVGYWANSTTLFKHALNVTTNNFLAHNALANVLATQGRFDGAILHYSAAARIRPEYADIYYNWGNALSEKKNHPEAIKRFRQAIQIRPDYAEAYLYLGHELALQGQRDEAIEYIRKAIQIKPDYAAAHNYLGYELAHQDKNTAAIEHLEKALQIRPDYARAHYNLGTVFVKQDRFDDAIKHFGESIRHKPDYAEAYNDIAMILAQQGKFDKAILLFQKALQLKPDYTTASMNLAKVIQSSKESN